jgi:hypothetical protein
MVFGGVDRASITIPQLAVAAQLVVARSVVAAVGERAACSLAAVGEEVACSLAAGEEVYPQGDWWAWGTMGLVALAPILKSGWQIPQRRRRKL